MAVGYVQVTPEDMQYYDDYRNLEASILAGTSFQDNVFDVVDLLGRPAISLLILVKSGLGQIGVKLNSLDNDSIFLEPAEKRFLTDKTDRLRVKKVFIDNSQSGAEDLKIQIFVN